MNQSRSRFLIWTLVLVILAIWIDLPNNPGLHLRVGGASLDRSFDTHLGLDLVGGVQALLEADLPADQVVSQDAMQTARAIVDNRVNGLGVSEAVVQQAGDRRILVELPGEKDPQKALGVLQKTGLLEFVDFSGLTAQEAQALEGTLIQTDFATTGQSAAPQAAETPAAAAAEATPAAGQNAAPAGGKIYHTIMTGAGLKDAQVMVDKARNYQVSFELQPDGAATFGDFTASHVGQPLALVLDKRVISAPRINSAIPDGKGVITGNYDYESANQLAIQLRYGSLPVPLKVVSTQTVGPTLGQDSLRKSLVAGLVGLGIVIAFMGLYYRLPGLVADVALLIYTLLVLALFKWIPVTLTLPGLAGFVLGVGVAVDANILIFERLKEELRAGRTLRQAIDLGWSRAWPSIRDSNSSTLITCLILFWFGNAFGASIVKGFSLTLAIGVGVSLFTAVIVTRSLLHLVMDRIQFSVHHKWFGVSE